ncbi:Homoprotocatechuate catabolism bifunctional isomerase/decarboxylase [Corynebacterium occultum]|uniref:Homoprotocatechuate catabolism bifunctional isomerase/decarboxylase n=1 Tax=Corynebacterium occultum TaxID=2675219 RepID=A0A6B8WQZ9_9CORY|nr:fumarylacetoacetate hydrolase family protein [Corynebacterium occultum]QGU08678.1 Homoprotocatechuate catabolism bifunctional isomerase/decarboxylase [Corynebacterium occultum]
MAQDLTVPVKPGKIIAVHVAFNSRAAQRGRWPKKPSYFLKAASSLAPSGAEIQRPEGTELLAFEGEIALVIGEAAKNVSLEQAWDHVAYVTASNDLGIYDYRAQDKGSNTRSKSRDGFTPLGPELIDARHIDPKALRIRTWVNGELVQEDGTSDEDLIFPLAQFVADLSQHMTLETGDVILTGTPAGSTVIVPGDVVEVEVDAPTAAGAPTSGRLSNTVVSGPGDFDPEIGMLPNIDDKQRADAWGTPELAGLPTDPHAISPELRAKLMAAPTAGLSAQLRARGLNQVVIEGVYPQNVGTKIVGPARTLRFLPEREDLFKTHGGGFNAQKQTFDGVREGEVLVIEARRQPESGTLGDILAIRAKARGAAGVVTDGGVRDYEAVREIGLPVFTQGAHPAVLGRRHVPWDFDLAIGCGNATVVPGDLIVGDDDGVIVIPRALAEEVADAALAKEHEDEWVAQRVAEGGRLDGLFPPTGANKEAYQAYLAANPVKFPTPENGTAHDSR